MITIKTHANYQKERTYILSTIFDLFLGLETRVEFVNEPDTKICFPNQKQLILKDNLFLHPESDWLTAKTLPKKPLTIWQIPKHFQSREIIHQTLPIIYPIQDTLEDLADHVFPFDLLGACFFMLTRYEEVVYQAGDRHDRFQAVQALAYQEQFFLRAIVNEYIELLWVYLQKNCPGLMRKQRQYQLMLTHDIDHLKSAVHGTWKTCAYQIMGDLIYRKNYVMAGKRLISKMLNKRNHFRFDPGVDIFDKIMTVSEQHGVTSAFYFIFQNKVTHGYGADYFVGDPVLLKVLDMIAKRKHEIGIHGGYDTYMSQEQFNQECDWLKQSLQTIHVTQETLGGRQHYLRWKNPNTWQIWDEAGLDYDSSLGFATFNGFRTGTCYPYHPYDLIRRKQLHLLEIPMIAMDVATFSDGCLALSLDDGLAHLCSLADICKHFSGVNCVLFHNEFLMVKKYFELYKRLIPLLLK